MNIGDTFVNKPAPGVPEHFWMVLSDPKDPRVVLVNVSSDDGGNTGLPTIQPGEHPFIKHTSHIRYDKARVEHTVDVEAVIAKKLVVPQTVLSSALLSRAQRALLASPLVPNEAKTILTRQGVAPAPPALP